jgi:glycosyltransferase involved in cell wall biosynthesis
MSMLGRRLHEVLVSERVGGGEAVAIRLAAAGLRRGVDTTAWVPGLPDTAAAAALVADAIPRRHYDLQAMRAGGGGHAWAVARLAVGVASRRRPVVHVHSPYVFGLLRRGLFATGARVVVHFHLEPTPEEVDWTLRVPPTHIVACARYIGDRIQAAIDRAGAQVPVSAVPNAVDLHRFRAGDQVGARSAIGLSKTAFVVLMLANLAPHKGQETALRATALLARRGVEVELWLVGEDRTPGGPYGQTLRELAASLDIGEAVRFLGFRQDTDSLLQAADALVLPSTHEGLPLCILEAQAAGVPVVGSDEPGIREIVEDGVTGFVVPAVDVDGYADRLERLSREPNRRRVIADAARARVETEHAWPVFEERVFAIYDSLGA